MTADPVTGSRTVCPYCGRNVRGTNQTDPDADRDGRPYTRFDCGTFLFDDEPADGRGRSGLCRATPDRVQDLREHMFSVWIGSLVLRVKLEGKDMDDLRSGFEAGWNAARRIEGKL